MCAGHFSFLTYFRFNLVYISLVHLYMICKQILRGYNKLKCSTIGINQKADKLLLICARCRVYAGHKIKCLCKDSNIISHIAGSNWVSSRKWQNLHCFLATIFTLAWRKRKQPFFSPTSVYISTSTTFNKLIQKIVGINVLIY